MKLRKKKQWIFFLLVMAGVLGMASLLNARVGGGEGYSGGGGSGGGSGGGDGLAYLIYLIFRYPKVGIPIAIIVIIFYLRSKAKNPAPRQPYSTLQTTPIPTPTSLTSESLDDSVTQLQQEDPNFSLPLFLDFAQLLYTHIIQFAGKQQIEKMNVYLAPPILDRLKTIWTSVSQTRDIIIGRCSLVGMNLVNPEENLLTIAYETNFTMDIHAGQKVETQTIYERSHWVLARQKGVISKGPGEMNRIGCPRCGGPLDDNPEEKCSYCGHEFLKGTMTWFVKEITIFDRTLKSPEITGGYAVEQGTQLPAVIQPGLDQKRAVFQNKYPDFNESAFYEKVVHIFKALQQAWSSQKWELARPFETDHLFQTHLYWINLYKKERIRNVLKDIRVLKIQLVKIREDAYYDALTVRVYAAMIDYKETFNGQLLGGDPGKPRTFSEYWTFIRRSGLEETDKTIDQCPNCGNSLQTGMTGKCNHCGSKITTGEFTWVLSMIEQDESYA